jgi:hypothetical protein
MMQFLKSAWAYTIETRYSAIAFLVTAVLGLLSMGLLGMALYYAVAFALPASYPNIDEARGDWVWPTVISVGMLWSVAFLLAGAMNWALKKVGCVSIVRGFVYALCLWSWALLLWQIALQGR